MKQNLQAISLDLFPSFHQGLFLLEVFKGPAPWDWTSDLRSSLMSWTICSDRFRYLDVDYCRYMGLKKDNLTISHTWDVERGFLYHP